MTSNQKDLPIMVQRVHFVLLVCLSAGGLASAQAQATSAEQFVSEDFFTPLDPDAVWDEINAGLSPASPDSVFLPTASIGPMPLAILAVDATEPPLERVRYRLRYGVDWVEGTPGGAPAPFSYIEVIRFNLGPAIREEMIETLGAEHVADPEEFGLGPHVAWRLVTQPLMGNRAIGVAAGRGEVPDTEAQHMECLGTPCLAPHSGIEALAPWSDMQMTGELPDAPFQTSVNGVLTPAAAIDMLLGEITEIESESFGSDPSIPDPAIEAVIDVNLGQDAGLDAAYRWGGLLDDSVAAIWRRLASVSAGGPEAMVFEAEAYECRRGPEFAPPGEFCP